MMRTVVVATVLSMLTSAATATLVVRLQPEPERKDRDAVSVNGWDHDAFARGLIETIVERINNADIERMRREVDALMAR